MMGLFVIKAKLFICLMGFGKQCNIFRTFTFFFWEPREAMSDNEQLWWTWIQIHEQVIKRWGKAHEMCTWYFS